MITFLKDINDKYKYNQAKISSLYKNNLMKGGGELMNCINIKLIIGILFIIIGMVFINVKTAYNELEANVLRKNGNISVIEYYVNNVRYEKILENNTNDNKIKIYYDRLNPNIIRLYDINYPLIGMIILIIAILLILI